MNEKTTETSKLLFIVVLALLIGPLLSTKGEAQQAVDVTAYVVAIDQVIVYNRLGAFNPAGMIFALARDVFPIGTLPENETLANSCLNGGCANGQVQLRSTKRPRPLTLRAYEGKNITIHFTNLLATGPIVDAGNAQPPGIQVPNINSEQPATRNVGIHIHGMQWVGGAAADGSNVGNNSSSLVPPGGSTTYTYSAEKEGAYTITSGPNLGARAVAEPSPLAFSAF